MKKSLALLALAATAASAQTPPLQGVTKDEIVWGMHTDLSGPAATWGVSSRNGAQMRIDEENAKGGVFGRKIRLIVEDSQYQVPRAVQAANKLLNKDQVFLMFGSLGTPQNNAAFPEQFALNVPNMFPFSGARSMGLPLHPLKWQALPTYYEEARSLTRYFIKAGRKQICSLYQDTEFGQEIFEGVRDELADQKMKIHETATNKPTDTDFSAQITRLKDANCDAVVLGSIVRDSIIPFVTSRRMGWNVDMGATVASFDFNVSGAANGATEGFYSTSSLDAPYEDSPNAAVAEWAKAYKAKAGIVAAPAALLGYVSADVVIKGLQGAGANLTTASYLKALESISEYKDRFGGPTQSYSATKHIGSGISHLYQVKGGKFVRIQENITGK